MWAWVPDHEPENPLERYVEGTTWMAGSSATIDSSRGRILLPNEARLRKSNHHCMSVVIIPGCHGWLWLLLTGPPNSFAYQEFLPDPHGNPKITINGSPEHEVYPSLS